MSWNPGLTKLRDLLAFLYPTEPLSRQVVAQAGMPAGHIVFTAAASTNWYNILSEADRRMKVQAIASVARKDFPKRSDELAEAEHEYLHPVPGRIKPPETVLIPAGHFLMGSAEDDPEGLENEQPQHSLELPDYRIAKYPVTNDQYQEFVHHTNHAVPKHWKDGQPPPGKGNHPVVCVSLDDTRAYCCWLTEATRRNCRLPTEQEWEKAARGPRPESRRYPWGEDWRKGYCNTREAGYGDTTPVSTFERLNVSPYGIVDAVGNVWEWTQSFYAAYPGGGPRQRYGTKYYVVRGGAWNGDREDARVCVRGRYPPGTKREYLGFRVVIGPS
jgi:formylglycine-generating enzyme required for sulfatase activity